MLRFAKRQTLHIWIAIMAVLFGALAPTVSHALAAGVSSDEVEICTIEGYKIVKLSTGEIKKSSGDAAHAMAHCGYCSTHAGSFALAPSVPAPLAIAGSRALYPTLFYRAPRPLASWAAAHPRAPPSLI